MRIRAGVGSTIAFVLLASTACTSHPAKSAGVLAPAPTNCAEPISPGRPLWDPSGLPAARLLGGHVPHWMPAGFGLSSKRHYRGEGEVRWTDRSCRAIWMYYTPGGRDEPVSNERVGRWTVQAMGKVGLVYVALILAGTVGLDAAHVGRSTMDRVALSVPL